VSERKRPLKVTRTIYGVPTVFEWWGGEYVDVMPYGGEAVDVLNVWAGNKPAGPVTKAYLISEVSQWKEQLDRSDWLDGYCSNLNRGAQRR